MYKIIRFFLFLLPAEFSHNLGLIGLKLAHTFGLSVLLKVKVSDRPCEVLGLTFPNPVGLAAGLDKNGDYIDALGSLGFGFIEIGTITPKPQAGNPKPRLFRLQQKQAIINRMGFNNKGVDYMVGRLKVRRYQGIIGVNIGKNFSTPVDEALADYLICFRKVYEYADYIVVNLSSPNTPGLRSLQFGEPLDELLLALKAEQQTQTKRTKRKVPFLVKIAPDLELEEIEQIAGSLKRHQVDGVIATNTTINREAIEDTQYSEEAGGLSGAPLTGQATKVIKHLVQCLGNDIPVIGVGGINNAQSASAKMGAGASLLQVYTSFIYKGPALIAELLEASKP